MELCPGCRSRNRKGGKVAALSASVSWGTRLHPLTFMSSAQVGCLLDSFSFLERIMNMFIFQYNTSHSLTLNNNTASTHSYISPSLPPSLLP